jgi:hypothetical protein
MVDLRDAAIVSRRAGGSFSRRIEVKILLERFYNLDESIPRKIEAVIADNADLQHI